MTPLTIFIVLSLLALNDGQKLRSRNVGKVPAKPQKRLRSQLNDYVEGKGMRARKDSRGGQSNKDYDPVSCVADFSSTCSSNKDEYLGEMFEAYKFRLYQVENNFQKYQRIKRFYQLIQNKALKKDEFKNSSLWLEAVVGGDVTSPTCNGNNGTTAGEAVATLFYSLAACNETLPASCNDDQVALEMNQEVFDQCNEANEQIKAKVDECNDIAEDQEEGRCQCFDGAVFMIEAFKAQQYEVVTPSGAVQRNCIEALKESSPKVVAQYQQCIAGLQACKKDEDAAIGIINACNSATSRVVVSHYRAFLAEQEDEDEEDHFMDYVDYDY